MTRNRMLASASALSVFALTACSGGGGDLETPDSTPANAAPQITGATVISVDENTISVTTVSASDADGDTLSYAITGGADGNTFEINSNSGVLTFAESPDFETPSDADTDNVYFVTVTVTDGSGGSAEATYEIAVANIPDVRYLEQIFTQTTRSEDIVYASGSDTYVMNVITPQGDTETQRPLALLASGGAFAVTNRNQVEPFAEVFARAGYTAAIIDYRTLGRQAENSTEFRFAAQDATHDMIGVT